MDILLKFSQCLVWVDKKNRMKVTIVWQTKVKKSNFLIKKMKLGKQEFLILLKKKLISTLNSLQKSLLKEQLKALILKRRKDRLKSQFEKGIKLMRKSRLNLNKSKKIEISSNRISLIITLNQTIINFTGNFTLWIMGFRNNS